MGLLNNTVPTSIPAQSELLVPSAASRVSTKSIRRLNDDTSLRLVFGLVVRVDMAALHRLLNRAIWLLQLCIKAVLLHPYRQCDLGRHLVPANARCS